MFKRHALYLKMRVVLKPERVLAVTPKEILCYKRGNIIVKTNDENQTVIASRRVNPFFYFQIINRLLRHEPRCAVPIGNDAFLISHNGKIINYNYKTNNIIIEHVYNKNMKNPLHFCKNPKTNEVYYGEYIWNTNKGPVDIYKRNSSGIWETVYTFKSNTITHIHNIVYDEYKDRYFVLTGDEDKESGIWIADSKFNRVSLILGGLQKYRACVVFPTEEGFIYATDTPLEQNYIYNVKLDNDNIVNISEICQLSGSCIYGQKVNGKYYFSTAVEPDSNIRGVRYLLTYKRGNGIKDNYSKIYEIDEKSNVNVVFASEKDILPMVLFQFGNFIFPYNETKRLVFVSQSLKCGHNNTIYRE